MLTYTVNLLKMVLVTERTGIKIQFHLREGAALYCGPSSDSEYFVLKRDTDFQVVGADPESCNLLVCHESSTAILYIPPPLVASEAEIELFKTAVQSLSSGGFNDPEDVLGASTVLNRLFSLGRVEVINISRFS